MHSSARGAIALMVWRNFWSAARLSLLKAARYWSMVLGFVLALAFALARGLGFAFAAALTLARAVGLRFGLGLDLALIAVFDRISLLLRMDPWSECTLRRTRCEDSFDSHSSRFSPDFRWLGSFRWVLRRWEARSRRVCPQYAALSMPFALTKSWRSPSRIGCGRRETSTSRSFGTPCFNGSRPTSSSSSRARNRKDSS